MKDFKVIILGGGINAYAAAVSINKKYNSIPIIIEDNLTRELKCSQIAEVIIDRNIKMSEHLGIILNAFGKKLKKEYNKLLIIPTTKEYTRLLNEIKFLLEDYENKFLTSDDFKDLNDINVFPSIFNKYDLNYPELIIVNYKNYKTFIRKSNLTYPVIIKLKKSNLFDESINKKIFYEEKKLLKELEIIYDTHYKDDIWVQNYIDGNLNDMRIVNIYSNKSGVVTNASVGKPVLYDKSGNQIEFASIMTVNDNEEYITKLTNFLNDIKYTGISSFILKTLNGKTYLLKMETFTKYLEFHSSFDLSLTTLLINDYIYFKDNTNSNIHEMLYTRVPLIILRKQTDYPISKFKKDKKIINILKYKNDSSLKRDSELLKINSKLIHTYIKKD